MRSVAARECSRLSIRKCPACGLGDGGQQQRHFLSGSGSGSGRAGRGGKPEPLNLSHLGSPNATFGTTQPSPTTRCETLRATHPASCDGAQERTTDTPRSFPFRIFPRLVGARLRGPIGIRFSGVAFGSLGHPANEPIYADTCKATTTRKPRIRQQLSALNSFSGGLGAS